MNLDELLASLPSRPQDSAPDATLQAAAALRLELTLSPEGKLLAARDGEPVPLRTPTGTAQLPPLPPVQKLFRGTASCREFLNEPPREYLPLFVCIERAAADWCAALGKPERDEEFERLYTQLRRRPDGRDPNPLFSWLRRGAQLGLLLRPTSEAEFDQVTRRLARSARTFRAHTTSTNYWENALREL